MRITYDPSVDALYIRFADGTVQCDLVRLNDNVAINLGPKDQVVGIEVTDASSVVDGLAERVVKLKNLTAA